MRVVHVHLITGDFPMASILCENMLTWDKNSTSEAPLSKEEKIRVRTAFGHALRRTREWKRALEQFPIEEELEEVHETKEAILTILMAAAECHLELIVEWATKIGRDGELEGMTKSDITPSFVKSSPHSFEMADHAVRFSQLTKKAMSMTEPGSAMQGSVLLLHGRLLDAQENYEEAKNFFERALSMMPHDYPDADPTAHRLGYIYLRLGQASRAIDMAKGNLSYISRMCENDDAKAQSPLILQAFAAWARLLGDAHVYLKNIEYGMSLREKSEAILRRISMSQDDLRKDAKEILEGGPQVMHSATERICCVCQKVDHKKVIMTCARCKKKYYCGAECQLKDWPYHKRECGK